MNVKTKRNSSDYLIYGEDPRGSSIVFILALLSLVFVDFIFLYAISTVLTIVVALILLGLLLRYFLKFEILINSVEIAFSKKIGEILFSKWSVRIDSINRVNPMLLVLNQDTSFETEIELLESFDDDCLFIKSGEREWRLGDEESSKQIFEPLELALRELYPQFF